MFIAAIIIIGLKAIAGSASRVIQAKNFEEIGTIAKSLLKKVCKALPGERYLHNTAIHWVWSEDYDNEDWQNKSDKVQTLDAFWRSTRLLVPALSFKRHNSVSCSQCYFVQIQPISQKLILCVTVGLTVAMTDRRAEWRTDTPSESDARTHLKKRKRDGYLNDHCLFSHDHSSQMRRQERWLCPPLPQGRRFGLLRLQGTNSEAVTWSISVCNGTRVSDREI